MTKPKEILVGNARTLDYLASLYETQDSGPHPLQELIEEVVEELSWRDQQVFYLRYGEQKSIRAIGKILFGYIANKTVQESLERIEEAVREKVQDYYDR